MTELCAFRQKGQFASYGGRFATHGKGRTFLSIVAGVVHKEDTTARVHMGVIFDGDNMSYDGKSYAYILYHHYSGHHRFEGHNSLHSLGVSLAEGIWVADIETVLGVRERFSNIACNQPHLKRYFHIAHIQPGFRLTCSGGEFARHFMQTANDGNGTCLINAGAILSKAENISSRGIALLQAAGDNPQAQKGQILGVLSLGCGRHSSRIMEKQCDVHIFGL